MRRSVMAALILGFLSCGSVWAAYQVGDTVADFTLNDSYGNPVSLYDFEGMAVLMNFWQDS